MESQQAIAFVWLALLTAFEAFSFWRASVDRKNLSDQIGRIEIAELLHTISAQLTKKAVHEDKRLREAVELLITRIERDPTTADRYAVDVTLIKEKLK